MSRYATRKQKILCPNVYRENSKQDIIIKQSFYVKRKGRLRRLCVL